MVFLKLVFRRVKALVEHLLRNGTVVTGSRFVDTLHPSQGCNAALVLKLDARKHRGALAKGFFTTHLDRIGAHLNSRHGTVMRHHISAGKGGRFTVTVEVRPREHAEHVHPDELKLLREVNDFLRNAMPKIKEIRRRPEIQERPGRPPRIRYRPRGH